MVFLNVKNNDTVKTEEVLSKNKLIHSKDIIGGFEGIFMILRSWNKPHIWIFCDSHHLVWFCNRWKVLVYVSIKFYVNDFSVWKFLKLWETVFPHKMFQRSLLLTWSWVWRWEFYFIYKLFWHRSQHFILIKYFAVVSAHLC